MGLNQLSGGVGVAPMAFCAVRVETAGTVFEGAVGARVEMCAAEIFVAREADTSGDSIAYIAKKSGKLWSCEEGKLDDIAGRNYGAMSGTNRNRIAAKI